MVENITEELVVGNVGRRWRQPPAAPSQRTVAAGQRFLFELCRKQTPMGDVPVDQFWMAHASVYSLQNGRARNRDAIVDYFWALCRLHGTDSDPEVQQSFILAKLFPQVRNYGARKVLKDAVLSRPSTVGITKRSLINDLDKDLATHRDREMGMLEFRDQTANLLDMPTLSGDEQTKYEEFQRELLEEGRHALTQSGLSGLHIPIQRWEDWMESIGRRSGRKVEKQVLNILSYESRAALHRCYSAVWFELLPQLAQKYSMNDGSLTFHRFWQFDQCQDLGDPQAQFHLFHGHIFALHPGSGWFLTTKTGAELMGEWLKEPRSQSAFQRMLHGMCLALGKYAQQYAIIGEERKKDAKFVTGYDLETCDSGAINQSERRCLPGVREDADDVDH